MATQGQRAGRAPVGTKRLEIVAAAAKLFAARGYHATGIDDIGEAVNVTGPAVYRHFAGKVDVLIEIVEGFTTTMMEGADRIAAEDLPAVEALDRLIDNFVTCTIEQPAAFAVMARERHHLPKDERRAIDRAHRRHVEEWVKVVREIHPRMSVAEASTLVHGVFGLGLPLSLEPKISGDEFAALLRGMTTEVVRRGTAVRRATVPA